MIQTQTQLNFKTAPGHQVLAAAGKKALRPGGYRATEQIFEWANFQPGETVLELAASFGYSAIALAQRYQVRVVGVEKNPDSVARAQANVAAAGLTQQVQIIQGDIFHLEKISEKFDYVLAEAILTMQSDVGKTKILAGIYDRLRSGGQFLSHELRVENPKAEIICRELSTTIRVNAVPLSKDGWVSLVEKARLKVENYQVGSMALLNPSRIAQEEGLPTLITIGWNMLTQPELRRRILAMRETFVRYSSDLGYVVLTARKET
ncbi:MAG: class I SAM-dependent methyltransferase [Coleofasciculaceae cyanobacterium SM2_1_6]|nr:class I SAM-dependent methyltransferase [Coleofasciculaceae cyanobacterium SM2_1_6]